MARALARLLHPLRRVAEPPNPAADAVNTFGDGNWSAVATRPRKPPRASAPTRRADVVMDLEGSTALSQRRGTGPANHS